MQIEPILQRTAISGSFTLQTLSRKAVEAIRKLGHTDVQHVLRGGWPAQEMVAEVTLDVHSRANLLQVFEVPGVKVLSARVAVTLAGKQWSSWGGNEFWLYLAGMEENLKAETELEGLRGAGRISEQAYNDAKWVFSRIRPTLRG